MWANIGTQQLHLSSEPEQVIDGEIGLLVPSLETIINNFTAFTQGDHSLKCSKIGWKLTERSECNFHVPEGYSSQVLTVTCPYGNTFRCYESTDSFIKNLKRGILYLLLNTPKDSTPDIQRYYKTYFDMTPTQFTHHKLHYAVGPWQQLIFVEKDSPVLYTDWHICFYITQFSSSYNKLLADNLLCIQHRFSDKCDTLEKALADSQFRTLDIPLQDGSTFKIMQEVRSCYHPSFYKPLQNN